MTTEVPAHLRARIDQLNAALPERREDMRRIEEWIHEFRQLSTDLDRTKVLSTAEGNFDLDASERAGYSALMDFCTDIDRLWEGKDMRVD